MAFLKISALPSIPEVADDDELAIVDTSETTTSKVTISDFLANITSISSVSGSDEARLITRVTPNPQSLIATTDGTMISQVAAFTESTSTGARAEAKDGVYESELLASASSADGEASGGITATDGTSVAQIFAGTSAGATVARSGALSGDFVSVIEAFVSASTGASVMTLDALNGTPSERAAITLEAAASILFRSLGSTIPLNESGHEALPSGITSLVQGLGLLDGLVNGNQLDAGTWDPNPSAGTNVSSMSALGNGLFLRVGDICVGAASFEATVDGTGYTAFRFDVPVSSSFSSSSDLIGIVRGQGVGSAERIVADTVSDRAWAIFSGSEYSNGIQQALFAYRVSS